MPALVVNYGGPAEIVTEATGYTVAIAPRDQIVADLRSKLEHVLAHPDDESFGMGGTLALYAQKGCDVYLICATRGEVGDVDPKHLEGFSSVAELREGELRCAAGHLGLKDVFFLDYRDSGMPGSPDNQHPDAQVAHPVEEVAGKVVRDVEAVVVQDLAVNLLGQSVLRELGGVELKGDEMVIRRN